MGKVLVLYDSASGTWTMTGSLNRARGEHTATLLPNGMVLVAGGLGSTNFSALAELYDTTSGTWTFTGRLNNARAGHTATLLPNGMVDGCRRPSSSDTNKCRTVPRPHAYAYSEPLAIYLHRHLHREM